MKESNVFNFLLIFLSITFIGSCNSNGEGTPVVCVGKELKMPAGYQARTLYTVIFLDYTDSGIVGPNSKAAIRQMLERYLVTPGDKIDIFLITANTATDVNKSAKSYELNIERRQEIISTSITDTVQKSMEYCCRRLVFIDSVQRSLDAFFQEQEAFADTAKYEASDVAGLFCVLDDKFRRLAKGVEKRIVVISDLEHNCEGHFKLRTRFVSSPYSSNSNVSEDYKIISSTVLTGNFHNVDIFYSTGELPKLMSSNPVQRDALNYWLQLCTKLGLNPTRL